MNSKLLLSLLLTLGVPGASVAQAAPPILSYAGQVSVNGQPFTGTGQFKFAFVDGQGQFSYWSHDGTSAAESGTQRIGQSAGQRRAYSVMLGDTALSGMSAIDEAVFQNHNDVHLRIWFSDGINGFEQLSPDRPLPCPTFWATTAPVPPTSQTPPVPEAEAGALPPSG